MLGESSEGASPMHVTTRGQGPFRGRGYRAPSKGDIDIGDIDIGIDVDVDLEVDSDMAVSINWGPFRGSYRAPLKGAWGLI